MTSLYVHIPFCQRKCKYCNFYSIPAEDYNLSDYVTALQLELQQKATGVTTSVTSIYFGGGTPSLLSLPQLAQLIHTIGLHYDLARPEITLEVNHSSGNDSELLGGYLKLGVNRLSVGVQSLLDHELALLGRMHSAHEAAITLERAIQIGYQNINVDVIFGLPGQTLAEFEYTLNRLLAFPVDHLSAYCLHVESGTPLEGELKSLGIVAEQEDQEGEFYEKLLLDTQHFGFEQYEISNFARNKQHSRHNLKYWTYQDYLGFGAGATSMLGNIRSTNVADVRRYMADPLRPAESIEILTKDQQIAEAMFMNLRLMDGVDLNILSDRYQIRLDLLYQDVLGSLREQGLIQYEPPRVKLTRKGFLLANEVFENFLL